MCFKCEKRFMMEEQLNSHDKNCKMKYQCMFCDSCYIRDLELRKHLSEYHGQSCMITKVS